MEGEYLLVNKRTRKVPHNKPYRILSNRSLSIGLPPCLSFLLGGRKVFGGKWEK